ncbi:MAG: hypothetical protein K9L74_01135 [Candidatus Izimaplasma sp.]|nr:hypothetical protein [Candidatus Izimaplasma bacterium]
MNKYWLIGFFSILICVLSIMQFPPKTPDTVIYSYPEVHSYYHTSTLETIQFKVLTTTPKAYYFDSEYLTTVFIQNETEKIPVTIKQIITPSAALRIEDKVLYEIIFLLRIDVSANSLSMQLPEAYLNLQYENQKELRIAMGEFNYLDQTNSTDLAVKQISATHELMYQRSTANGIFIELKNTTTSPITLTNINIPSATIIPNYRLIKEVYETLTFDDELTEILNQESYNLFTLSPITPLSLTLLPSQSLKLYIPLSYTHKRPLQRFPLILTYVNDSTEKLFFIDDFPYIKTTTYTSLAGSVKYDIH